MTKKGEDKLKEYSHSDYELLIPRTWDKKWRVLIFDIPEHRRTLRNKIRNTLIGIGFLRVQYSVWIFPYDCEELVTLLKADFRIGKDLLYLIVERIENDHEVDRYDPFTRGAPIADRISPKEPYAEDRNRGIRGSKKESLTSLNKLLWLNLIHS